MFKIFSDQYNTFLNELVRLFPYKLEIRFLTTYAATFTCEYLLEEGSKHISAYVESAISNRDVEGLVYLVPDNHKSTVRGYVNELHSQKRASCSKSAGGLLQVAIIKPISGCVRIACSGLMTTSLLQVVNRLAASCDLQTCCKLRTADLLQVANDRLAAICELQTCCKLRTADLLQVVAIVLAANCQNNLQQACS